MKPKEPCYLIDVYVHVSPKNKLHKDILLYAESINRISLSDTELTGYIGLIYRDVDTINLSHPRTSSVRVSHHNDDRDPIVYLGFGLDSILAHIKFIRFDRHRKDVYPHLDDTLNIN